MGKELVIDNGMYKLVISQKDVRIIDRVGTIICFVLWADELPRIRDFFNSLFVENGTPIATKTNKYAVSLVYQKGQTLHVESYIINAFTESEALGNGLIKFAEPMRDYGLITHTVIEL